MTSLVKQEFYKLNKKRSTQIFLVLILAFQLIIAFCSSRYPKFISVKDTFINTEFVYIPIIFFYIAICSGDITSERQYGTLKSLLYRQFSFNQVLFSKIIVLLSHMISVYLISSLFNLLLKLTFLSKFSLTGKIWKIWFLTNISQVLTLIFLMSLVILLSTLLNNSNLAIITGIIGYFAINVFNQFLLYLISKFHWLKWNPLNMMNLGDQLQNHHLQSLTRLSITELSIGYTVYILLFVSLAFLSFRKREI